VAHAFLRAVSAFVPTVFVLAPPKKSRGDFRLAATNRRTPSPVAHAFLRAVSAFVPTFLVLAPPKKSRDESRLCTLESVRHETARL
jgi:hypothetical protein